MQARQPAARSVAPRLPKGHPSCQASPAAPPDPLISRVAHGRAGSAGDASAGSRSPEVPFRSGRKPRLERLNARIFGDNASCHRLSASTGRCEVARRDLADPPAALGADPGTMVLGGACALFFLVGRTIHVRFDGAVGRSRLPVREWTILYRACAPLRWRRRSRPVPETFFPLLHRADAAQGSSRSGKAPGSRYPALRKREADDDPNEVGIVAATCYAVACRPGCRVGSHRSGEWQCAG